MLMISWSDPEGREQPEGHSRRVEEAVPWATPRGGAGGPPTYCSRYTAFVASWASIVSDFPTTQGYRCCSNYLLRFTTSE